MNTALKPCPPCGGKAFLNSFERGSDWGGDWVIKCGHCELALALPYLLDQAKPKTVDGKNHARERIITRWNRRSKQKIEKEPFQ